MRGERQKKYKICFPYMITQNVLKLKNREDDIELPENYSENSELCCVCMANQKNTVIYPCGHRALCNACAKDVKSRASKRCPLCRTQIKDIITIYS